MDIFCVCAVVTVQSGLAHSPGCFIECLFYPRDILYVVTATSKSYNHVVIICTVYALCRCFTSLLAL